MLITDTVSEKEGPGPRVGLPGFLITESYQRRAGDQPSRDQVESWGYQHWTTVTVNSPGQNLINAGRFHIPRWDGGGSCSLVLQTPRLFQTEEIQQDSLKKPYEKSLPAEEPGHIIQQVVTDTETENWESPKS